MTISEIKQLQAVDDWIDFSGQITKVGELKPRTKANKNMQKLKIADQTGDIGAWVYATQQFLPGQTISANGMLKEYQGVRYIDYAKLKNSQPYQGGQWTPPQGQQAPQQTPRQAPQQATPAPNLPQQDYKAKERTSIERQAAFKAACEYCGRIGIDKEALIEITRAGHYFIETGRSSYDIPQPDPEIVESPSGDDIPF